MRYLIIPIAAFMLASCSSITGDYNTLNSDVQVLKSQVATLNNNIRSIHEKVSKTESLSNTVDGLRENQMSLNEKMNQLSKDISLVNDRLDKERYSSNLTQKESKTDRDILKAQLETLETMIKELQIASSKVDASKKPAADSSDDQSVRIPVQPSLTKDNAKGKPLVKATHTETKPVKQLTSKKSVSDEGDTSTNEEAAPVEKNESEKAAAPVKKLAPYEAAKKDFDSGSYKAARDKLFAHIKQQPDAKDISDSYYLVAESYYKEGSYEDAIIHYEDMIKKFPKAKNTPDALYKQGISFNKLGGEQNMETARLIFKQLVNKYPSSDAAKKAKKELASGN